MPSSSTQTRLRGVRVLGKCTYCGMPLPLLLPPGLEPVAAPDWLRARVPTVRLLFGAQLEGSGGTAPEVQDAAHAVVMSCPSCGSALRVTGETERTTTCEYCQTDVYLPDDLWLRLHPVRKAELWYIEYEGESSSQRARRLQEAEDARRRAQEDAEFDRKFRAHQYEQARAPLLAELEALDEACGQFKVDYGPRLVGGAIVGGVLGALVAIFVATHGANSVRSAEIAATVCSAVGALLGAAGITIFSYLKSRRRWAELAPKIADAAARLEAIDRQFR